MERVALGRPDDQVTNVVVMEQRQRAWPAGVNRGQVRLASRVVDAVAPQPSWIADQQRPAGKVGERIVRLFAGDKDRRWDPASDGERKSVDGAHCG